MDAAGVTYQVKVYPNSPHGFHDDSGSAYTPETATQAWMDTLNWFARYLELPTPTFS
jgi:carboxymethylenebutenolidase